MSEHTFCVLLQIKTSDPRLNQAAIVEAMNSGKAGDFARVRRVLMHALPRDVERVIALIPVEHARLLMQLHEEVGEDITKFLRAQGVETNDAGTFVRPPADYVPPTTE